MGLSSLKVILQRFTLRQRLNHDQLEELVRKRTEELSASEDHLSRIIKASKLGTWDRNVITDEFIFNERWAAMLGYTKEELAPEISTLKNLLHPEDRNRVLEALDRHIAANTDAYNNEFRMKTKSGNWKYIYSSGEVSRRDDDGNPLVISGIHMDITKRRLAEEELIGYRDHLEDMVRRRTIQVKERIAEANQLNDAMGKLLTDLQTANEQFKLQADELNQKTTELENANIKLQEMDRLKSMFIATMSHELRTPLNSIIGFTGIILQGLTGEINAEQQDQLQRVYASAKHLLALITDIIDISKIEVGRVDINTEKFDIDDVLRDIKSNFTGEIDDKGLHLEINSPAGLQLISDRKRVLECLFNYVSNAVKFTNKGNIWITVREVDNMVEFEVKDTGIGIRKDDMPKLFGSFVRLETPQRGTAPGTGLGLYLTKKLVTEVLGGQVSVESEFGKGSTFIMRIAKEITAHKTAGYAVKT